MKFFRQRRHVLLPVIDDETLDWLPKVISEKPERGALLGAPEITFGKRSRRILA
jgi:hypothetical protein